MRHILESKRFIFYICLNIFFLVTELDLIHLKLFVFFYFNLKNNKEKLFFPQSIVNNFAFVASGLNILQGSH